MIVRNCRCGGEIIIEHEGTKYFACCVECTYQTKETFLKPNEAYDAWDKGDIEKTY